MARFKWYGIGWIGLRKSRELDLKHCKYLKIDVMSIGHVVSKDRALNLIYREKII